MDGKRIVDSMSERISELQEENEKLRDILEEKEEREKIFEAHTLNAIYDCEKAEAEQSRLGLENAMLKDNIKIVYNLLKNFTTIDNSIGKAKNILSKVLYKMERSKQKDLIEVYVWPDYDWLLCDDYCEQEDAWRGDDYMKITLPRGICATEIYDYLRDSMVQG